MKLESNNKSAYRNDYEQFSRFLKGSQIPQRSDMHTHPAEDICRRERPIAMVYCEEQEWRKLFDITIGLTKGTIFEELDLPLINTGCKKGGCMGW